MNINFILRGVELNQAEIEQLRRKAEFAIGSFREKIASMDLVMEDLNGPRGGEDKLCRVVLHLATEPVVILQNRGENSVATGIAALERVAQVLARRFEKAHARRQNGTPLSVSTP